VILFELSSLRASSIAQVYCPTFIRELGTKDPYHETYVFWTNPENIITTDDLIALYRPWEFFFFLYHIFVVKVQEIAWSASYGENKTQNPKQTNKGNIRHQNSSTGVRTGPRPTYGHEIQVSIAKETLPKAADSMKNNKL